MERRDPSGQRPGSHSRGAARNRIARCGPARPAERAGASKYRATAGGEGQGPSEFRYYPRALVIFPGDTIQVQDFLDRVRFAPNGDFVRRETTDRQALVEVLGGRFGGARWLADGSLFAPIYHWDRSPGPPQPGSLSRPAMTLVRVSADFSVVDTLGDYGGILQQYRDVGGGVRSIVPPFATATSWALGSGDGTIVVGDNASPRIDLFRPDGTRSIVRWTAEPEPVTDADVEAWKERQRSAWWTQGQLPQLERGWATMDVPETKAFYGRVSVGSDGRIWVGPVESLADSTTLMAFDERERYIGTVEIPGRFVPHDSGPGWILGVTRDESGVEYIQMYEVHPQ